MSKNINIAVIGLGQIGSYVYNELNIKKKDIEIKTGKKIKIVGISAKNKNKKRRFKINKKIFYSNPLDILKIKNLHIIIEAIGLSDGISKKVIETALKNKIHVITPNKALISKYGDKLGELAEKNKFHFTPHLTPMFRGILSTIYVDIKKGATLRKIQNVLTNHYKSHKFVKISKINTFLSTNDVINTNNCLISVCNSKYKDKIIMLSAIDNLIKGGGGQAVQNMNYYFKFNEGEGLNV